MRVISKIVSLCLFVSIPCAARYRVAVPYNMGGNGKITVKANINGINGNFIIDTGAPCCLTETFAKKVSLQAGHSVNGQDSNGKIIKTQIHTIDSLNLAGTKFMHLQAMLLTDPMLSKFGIDGIIGYNLMRQGGFIKFDNQAKMCTFTDYENGLGISPAKAIPMVPDAMIPLLPINVGKTAKDTVMFDSGASGFYEMADSKTKRLTQDKNIQLSAIGKGVLSMGAGGLDQFTQKNRISLKNMSIGEAQFANLQTITTSGKDSRIGSSILNYGNVIIDYKNQLFYYLPNTESIVNIAAKSWDVELTVMNDKLTAGLVWNTCKDKNLESGMRIVAVNGKRFDTVNLLEATTKNIVNLTGNKSTITYIDKNGKENTTEIYRR